MLRKSLIVLSAVILLGAVAAIFVGVGSLTVLLVWVALQAGILLALVVFERGRYRAESNEGPWTPTAERFQDPTSGKWVIVEYNPRTGRRRYVDEAGGGNHA